MSRAVQLEAQALRFHQKHPEVWEEFSDWAFERIGQGFDNYSAKGIWERIRWDWHSPHYGPAEWKLNNNYASIYARWWMEANPEHDGFFRTRVRPSKSAPVVKGLELRPSDFD